MVHLGFFTTITTILCLLQSIWAKTHDVFYLVFRPFVYVFSLVKTI